MSQCVGEWRNKKERWEREDKVDHFIQKAIEATKGKQEELTLRPLLYLS